MMACQYEDGVALYAAHGNDVGLKTLLGFGETRYNARKLYAAMEDLQQRRAQAEQINEEVEVVAEFAEAERDPRLSELYTGLLNK